MPSLPYPPAGAIALAQMVDSRCDERPDAREMKKTGRRPRPASNWSMGGRLLLNPECRVVELDVLLPLLWHAGLWENRGHRAHRFACAAVDALFRMDEQHRLQLLLGDARLRRDVRRLPPWDDLFVHPRPGRGIGNDECADLFHVFVNAVYRADLDAGSVLGVDAGLG